MKNILKILHQFFLGLGKKNIVNTRFVPSSNQYESYFDEIISRDKILSKIKLNKNSIVLGSCFSIRLANFFYIVTLKLLFWKKIYINSKLTGVEYIILRILNKL